MGQATGPLVLPPEAIISHKLQNQSIASEKTRILQLTKQHETPKHKRSTDKTNPGRAYLTTTAPPQKRAYTALVLSVTTQSRDLPVLFFAPNKSTTLHTLHCTCTGTSRAGPVSFNTGPGSRAGKKFATYHSRTLNPANTPTVAHVLRNERHETKRNTNHMKRHCCCAHTRTCRQRSVNHH